MYLILIYESGVGVKSCGWSHTSILYYLTKYLLSIGKYSNVQKEFSFFFILFI